MTQTFIYLGIFAWIIQITLGWWQVSAFNRYFANFCHLYPKARITLGRSKGRFKPKVIVVLAISNDQVIDNFILKGISIFSRPETIPELNQQTLYSLQNNVIFPK